MKRKIIAFVLLAAIFAGGVFVGCSYRKDKKIAINEISVFGNIHLTDEGKNILSMEMFEEQTGVKLLWSPMSNGNVEEGLELMLSSKKYSDMILYEWDSRSIERVWSHGAIIPLNEKIERNMPNLSRLMKENPDITKQIVTLDGEIYYLPYIRMDSELCVYTGPVIREDWLNNLGLAAPDNADELYEVLKAFKTQDPNGNGVADEIPMSGITSYSSPYSISWLMNMFNTYYGFYVDNGEVRYGPCTDEFREALRYIAKLYSEGLIDPDYLLQDEQKLDTKIRNNLVGFSYHYQPTRFTDAKDVADNIPIVGIPHLRNEDGERRNYDTAYVSNVVPRRGIAISSSCKDPDSVLKALDWFYSDEGIEAMNFGRENETFVWENGKRVFKEEITADKAESFRTRFAAFGSWFPTVQLWESYSQSLSEEGRDAINVWIKDVNTSGTLPNLAFTKEEAEIINKYLPQIQNYIFGNVDRIITGKADISEFDTMQETLYEMGINEILNVYREAYGRYIKG